MRKLIVLMIISAILCLSSFSVLGFKVPDISPDDKDLCGTPITPEYEPIVTPDFIFTFDYSNDPSITSPENAITDNINTLGPVKKIYYKGKDTSTLFNAIVLKPNPQTGLLKLFYEFGLGPKCKKDESYVGYLFFAKKYGSLTGVIEKSTYGLTEDLDLANVGIYYAGVNFYLTESGSGTNIFYKPSCSYKDDGEFYFGDNKVACTKIYETCLKKGDCCRMNDNRKLNYQILKKDYSGSSDQLSCYCRSNVFANSDEGWLPWKNDDGEVAELSDTTKLYYDITWNDKGAGKIKLSSLPTCLKKPPSNYIQSVEFHQKTVYVEGCFDEIQTATCIDGEVEGIVYCYCEDI